VKEVERELKLNKILKNSERGRKAAEANRLSRGGLEVYLFF